MQLSLLEVRERLGINSRSHKSKGELVERLIRYDYMPVQCTATHRTDGTADLVPLTPCVSLCDDRRMSGRAKEAAVKRQKVSSSTTNT
jgi:hypothetical protein